VVHNGGSELHATACVWHLRVSQKAAGSAGREACAVSHARCFPLINPKTQRFKREIVRSLATKELKQAKRRDHQEALKAARLFDAAVEALTPAAIAVLPVDIDLKQLGDEV
jgi:hypothetical protein